MVIIVEKINMVYRIQYNLFYFNILIYFFVSFNIIYYYLLWDISFKFLQKYAKKLEFEGYIRLCEPLSIEMSLEIVELVLCHSGSYFLFFFLFDFTEFAAIER